MTKATQNGTVPQEWLGENALMVHGESGHFITVFSSLGSVMTGRFELYQHFSGRGDTVLFLRDPSRLYYHDGLGGLSGTIEESAEFLRYLIGRFGPERTSFVGLSSGGYAAILHALLVGADDVFAMNPRTYMDDAIAERLGCGPRLPEGFSRFADFYAGRGEAPRFLDLRAEIEARLGAVRFVAAHYSTDDRFDAASAAHISGLPGVRLVPHDDMAHGRLGRMLTESGTLERHLATPVDQLEALYGAA